MINKIVTLENNEKYLIILNENLLDKSFLVGVKVLDEKYTNEFKLFLEIKQNNESLLEEIKDEELLKVIINNYILKTIGG